MRKIVVAILVLGYCGSAFATDARVLTMGRVDDYFMDDISVFRNPANVSIYPNMLMGSMGIFVQDTALDVTGELEGLSRYNRDPQKPFFGGILSYSLNQSADAGDQYPMLSVGGVFNRYDYVLDHLLDNGGPFFGISKKSRDAGIPDTCDVAMLKPVGKIDMMVGYALKNGAMIGGGAYFAFQEEMSSGSVGRETKLVKGSIGANIPVAKTMDLETSIGLSMYTAVGTVDTGGPTEVEVTVAERDIGVRADIRLFSALSALNGDFVPHAGFELLKFHEGKSQCLGINAGVGININIDRGFFWAGLSGLYEEDGYKDSDFIGGRIAFGIERNVLWDWFVWRVGVSKTLGRQKVGTEETFYENAEADASDKDHVSFGWGLNIENRLKVDVVMAEDIFYTWTNLISGNHHHIASRITATYSF